MTYRHYSTQVSLYSGKTRAYLRYKDVPFEDVTATIPIYRKVIVPNIGRPIIPVLETPEGELLQDTTVIIDALEERFPEPSIYPDTPLQRLVALLIEVYADEWLVMPAMHYRWHFKRDNLLFILREFGATGMPWLPRALQPIAGIPPALAFGGGYKKYFGITKKMHQPIERSLEALFVDLDRHFQEHNFLLGTRPSIGDFGLVAPMYAHLYRDPYPGRLMKRIAPHLARWVERMQHPAPKFGEFLPDDGVPETLLPVLQRMFDEQVPVLIDTIRHLDRWAAAHPDRKRVSRVIGKHRYRLGGVEEERMVTPFSLWMWQRPLFYYRSLDDAGRAAVDPLIEQLGGLEAMQTVGETTLAYRDHKVVIEGR